MKYLQLTLSNFTIRPTVGAKSGWPFNLEFMYGAWLSSRSWSSKVLSIQISQLYAMIEQEAYDITPNPGKLEYEV